MPEPHSERLGLATFEIPLELPTLPISQAWHPRYEADPAHMWLRGCIREIAGEVLAGRKPAPALLTCAYQVTQDAGEVRKGS